MFVPFKSHICFIKGTRAGWKPHAPPRFTHTFAERVTKGREKERGKERRKEKEIRPILNFLHTYIRCEFAGRTTRIILILQISRLQMFVCFKDLRRVVRHGQQDDEARLSYFTLSFNLPEHFFLKSADGTTTELVSEKSPEVRFIHWIRSEQHLRKMCKLFWNSVYVEREIWIRNQMKTRWRLDDKEKISLLYSLPRSKMFV